MERNKEEDKAFLGVPKLSSMTKTNKLLLMIFSDKLLYTLCVNPILNLIYKIDQPPSNVPITTNIKYPIFNLLTLNIVIYIKNESKTS